MKDWCYISFPSYSESLVAEMTPKRLWKYRNWMARWERRYKQPFREVRGELVEYSGITFITDGMI